VRGLDPDDAEFVRRTELAWWVMVPLREGDTTHGALQLGMRAERERPGEDDLAFFELLAERATAGLAVARLMAELQRTRRRL
jgi:transcriptional regulator with GAF, ATPase, and Fis domain